MDDSRLDEAFGERTPLLGDTTVEEPAITPRPHPAPPERDATDGSE